jgi:hypothetical protein
VSTGRIKLAAARQVCMDFRANDTSHLSIFPPEHHLDHLFSTRTLTSYKYDGSRYLRASIVTAKAGFRILGTAILFWFWLGSLHQRTPNACLTAHAVWFQ